MLCHQHTLHNYATVNNTDSNKQANTVESMYNI